MCGTLCLLCRIPAIFTPSPLPLMQCCTTLQHSLSLQTTLHGEREGGKGGGGGGGRGRIWPKEHYFVSMWRRLMVEALHSARVSHIILARTVVWREAISSSRQWAVQACHSPPPGTCHVASQWRDTTLTNMRGGKVDWAASQNGDWLGGRAVRGGGPESVMKRQARSWSWLLLPRPAVAKSLSSGEASPTVFLSEPVYFLQIIHPWAYHPHLHLHLTSHPSPPPLFLQVINVMCVQCD